MRSGLSGRSGRLGSGGVFCASTGAAVVLRGSEGGASSAVEALLGRGGSEGLVASSCGGGRTEMPLDGLSAKAPPLTCDAGRGRLAGGGGGARLPAPGGGAWKFFCLLRAAIRSARVVNCGSSTSAMLEEKRKLA